MHQDRSLAFVTSSGRCCVALAVLCSGRKPILKREADTQPAKTAILELVDYSSRWGGCELLNAGVLILLEFSLLFFFFCNIMLMWRTFPVERIVEIVRECTEDFMRHIAFGMASRMGS